MWKGERLLDLAVLVTVWVLAVQYFVNFFLRGRLKSFFYEKKELLEEDAEKKVNGFEAKLRVVVALALIAAGVLGTIGWVTS